MTRPRGVLGVLFIVIGLASLLVTPVLGQDSNQEVYVATVSGTIDLGMTPYIKRVIGKAEDVQAAAVILDINTPGGRLDAALAIKDALLDAEVPVIAYVNREAFSASALIAIAANTIYIAPGGVIGAATPVDGLGTKASEKVVSAVRTDFKSVAELRGRDADIAEAMVDEEVAIEGLVEEGKLLTLTSIEALKWGYSEGEVADLEALLEAEGLAGATVINVDLSFSERMVRFITNPAVAGILISLGFLGLLAELTSPGFGVPGLAGLLLLALFFWGHMLAELTGWEGVALVVVGLALIAIELLVIPGFGVAGLLGLAAFFTGLFIAMVGQGAATSDFFRTTLVLLGATTLMIIGAWLILRFLPRRRLFRGLSLQTSLARGSGLEESPDGSQHVESTVHSESHVSLVGARGIALTDLRPAGVARIDNHRVDVVTEGGFIEEGRSIEVIADEEYRRVVKAVEDPEPDQTEENAPQT
jgi:membrane-bound serine protease (ClpP class)